MRKRLQFLIFGLFFISIKILAQEVQVQGKVIDEDSAALPGVSVRVKGTGIKVGTNLNGDYSIIANFGQTLVFSLVGSNTIERIVGKESVVNVRMEASISELGEVVVTAFGTQKKTDVIGSVTSINPSELKVPSSNLTTALAGRMAGVIAFQQSGEPGADNAQFFIRGITTFGHKKDPLILIDGIELSSTDLARLQPDDIAQFSIMKDATATALYGARGANGVILVTTKEGKVGKANINVRIENSISQATQDIELVDPVTYMRMSNEAVLTRNPLSPQPYQESQIDHTIAGTNPYVFPANDWKQMLFKDYTMNRRLNMSINGGGSVARYYVAGSVNQDNGILKVDKRNNFNSNIDLKSYNLRSNVNIDIAKSTEMIVRLNGSFDDYTGPMDGGAEMYRKVMRSNPVKFPAYFEKDEAHSHVSHILFGNSNFGEFLNPYADLMRGYKDYSRSLMLATVEVKQDLSFLTKGLRARVMANTTRSSFFDISRHYSPFYYEAGIYDKYTDNFALSLLNEEKGTEYLSFSGGDKLVNSTFYLETVLNYDRKFSEKHSVSGLMVYMMQESLSPNTNDLQLSLPSRNTGLSGRTTYSYDDRYFGEFNFGYNGSERFHESRRFGFFPSGGVAWSVSNEKFFESFKTSITKFRLRATYGLVGNDEIGSPADRFFYLSNVIMSDGAKGASFGTNNGYSLTGINVSRYSNVHITWEKALKTNFALELSLFNKLDFIGEYYTEKRTNILMPRASIPSTMGLTADVKANVGEATGKGVDLSLDYSDNFGGLWLVTRGNFTYAASKYKIYEEPDYDEKYLSRIGFSIGQEKGYIAERLFIDDADVANSPKQNFGEYMPGDIKYRDINGDGEITTLDQVSIGFPVTPEITYGFGFSAGLSRFDFSAFFQGSARQSFWIDPVATGPFVGERQLLKAYADDHWSEDERDIYALWPRLSATSVTNNHQVSTWFMRNASFLRLKSLELGYSFSANVTDRLGMNKFRVYANGTNLFLLTGFDLWDVEMAGNGLGYPLQKVVNLGLNVTF